MQNLAPVMLSAEQFSQLVTKNNIKEHIKDYLDEYLDERLSNFATKDYLDEKLNNFATKDDFSRLEESIKMLDYKIEKSFNYLYGKLETVTLNHEMRLSKLEYRIF